MSVLRNDETCQSSSSREAKSIGTKKKKIGQMSTPIQMMKMKMAKKSADGQTEQSGLPAHLGREICPLSGA